MPCPAERLREQRLAALRVELLNEIGEQEVKKTCTLARPQHSCLTHSARCTDGPAWTLAEAEERQLGCGGLGMRHVLCVHGQNHVWKLRALP